MKAAGASASTAGKASGWTPRAVGVGEDMLQTWHSCPGLHGFDDLAFDAGPDESSSIPVWQQSCPADIAMEWLMSDCIGQELLGGMATAVAPAKGSARVNNSRRISRNSFMAGDYRPKREPPAPQGRVLFTIHDADGIWQVGSSRRLSQASHSRRTSGAQAEPAPPPSPACHLTPPRQPLFTSKSAAPARRPYLAAPP